MERPSFFLNSVVLTGLSVDHTFRSKPFKCKDLAEVSCNPYETKDQPRRGVGVPLGGPEGVPSRHPFKLFVFKWIVSNTSIFK
jgi:hypothetical protein